MKSISLVHIKRIGLANWRNREWWAQRNVRIWSQEHCLWWRPEGKGYTRYDIEAWVVDFPTAYEHTKHCGPEKKINYYVASNATPANRSTAKATAIVGDDRESMGSEPMKEIVTGGSDPAPSISRPPREAPHD